jgi:ABC-2 type transport system permease protein
MIKNIFTIFFRDIKVNTRDFISLYILLIPVLLGVGINLLSPSVNDTTINLAMLASDDVEKVAYLEQFAIVELFPSIDEINNRLEKRDNVVAILPNEDGSYILTQGNEPEGVIEYVKVLNTFHDLDMDVAETTVTFESFGKTEPPLKKMLVNLVLLMTSILAGMLISINIIEEKMDNTVSAMNVSPVSRVGFILGKSMMGIFLAVYGPIALLYITGFGDVNMGQMMVAILAVTIISILIGFIQGIVNDDVMDAAASVKMMFLPVGAAVAAVELLSDKWQVLFYWIPFYWTYKGNISILSYTATWTQIVGYTAIVILIAAVTYAKLAPKIQKGLSG